MIRGVRTSEFWTTVAAAVGSILAVLVPDATGNGLSASVQSVIVAVGGLVVASYGAGRAHVKAAASKPSSSSAPGPSGSQIVAG